METTLTDRVLGGRYELGPLLGRGGMADVYDAVDTRLGRPVAVKVLRPAMATRPDVRRRFEDEARAAAKLAHPNVVAVYDTGEDEGLPWIVMERLSGETLASAMVPGRPLQTDFVLRVAGDVLSALSAAHAAGVVHRDVKPGNILFNDEGCAKVADFGIAKSIEGVSNATTAGMLLGTPRYLSPERVDGRPTTVASDIYAVGVVLYEALTGRRAFEGDTPVSVAYAVQHTTPPPIGELRPDLSPALVAVVEKAMAHDPADRYATAAEMADAVAAVQPNTLAADDDATVAVAQTAWAAGSPDATAVAAAQAPPWPGQRGIDPRIIVVLAVAAAILLVLGVLATNDRNSTGGDNAGSAQAAPSGSPTTAALRDAAKRLAVGDGDKGREAATRLEAIAAKLDAGQSASDDANALLRDGAEWRAEGDLGVTAFETMRDALLKVPGVDPNAGALVTVEAGEEKGEGKGEGKGKDDDKKDD